MNPDRKRLSDRRLRALLKGLREDVAAPADFRQGVLRRLQAEGLLAAPPAPAPLSWRDRWAAWPAPARLGLGLGAAMALAVVFLPGLRDVKLRIQADRRGLQVRARVSLQAPEDLGAATEAVQAAIRRRLQQVVGPETDIRPRVMVAKILARSDDDDSATPRRRVRPPRP
jgi:hypothetical protein